MRMRSQLMVAEAELKPLNLALRKLNLGKAMHRWRRMEADTGWQWRTKDVRPASIEILNPPQTMKRREWKATVRRPEN